MESFLSYDAIIVIMRQYLMLLLILLLVVDVSAVTMKVKDSYYRDSKNITLLAMDYLQKTADFCVNGRKGTLLLTKKEVTDINGAKLEVYDNGLSFVKIRINIEPCADCFCGRECSNAQCYNLPLPQCNDDLECNDNKTETNDRCLKQKCFNVLEGVEDKKEIEKKEEIIESFKGVQENKIKSKFIFISVLIILLIIIIIVAKFIFRK